MAEIIALWEPGDPAGEQHQTWADDVADALTPAALPGGCVNRLGPDASDQIAHAYDPDAARPLAIKAQYDPHAVFTATPLP